MLRSPLAFFSSLLARLHRGPAIVAPTAPPVPALATHSDVEHVHELVGRATEMTSLVAQHVGEHNVSVQAISRELTAVTQNDPAAVTAIVCKLLVANQELQGRLERAEQTLQSHSRQLREAVTSSRTDALTGLLNRRALDEALNRSLAGFRAGEQPPLLMMLDVDRFKQLNDTFGHIAGDQVLVHIANVLRREAQVADVVARYGGEEFAVIFGETSAAAIRPMAERLRSAIAQQPIVYDERTIEVTASAGLAAAQATDAAADWIKRADEALYAAKKAGRNCGFEATGAGPIRWPLPISESPASPQPQCPATRNTAEAAAELAAEAFDDTTFVPSIARRIAEWRRGGATLTVILARLDTQVAGASEPDPQSPRPAIRVGLQLARACVREMDLVTRWQGDGLAFLLPCTSANEARLFARRLRATFDSANSTLGERLLPLSISMGIAEGIEGNDAKRVLERAWLALASASACGPASIHLHDGVKTVAVKTAAAARC